MAEYVPGLSLAAIIVLLLWAAALTKTVNQLKCLLHAQSSLMLKLSKDAVATNSNVTIVATEGIETRARLEAVEDVVRGWGQSAGDEAIN